MNVSKRLIPLTSNLFKRSLSTSATNYQDAPKGFFGSLFAPEKIEVQSSSHSAKLSAKDESMIELQTHNVKPDSLDKYMVAHERLCEYIKANENEGLNLHCQCYGNFTVFVGDQDQFIHIWKFRDGYSTLDNEKKAMESNSEYKALKKDLRPFLTNRHNKYAMKFSYWPEPYMRTDPKKSHIYELRNYHLKPGTMVEWGNYWAKAIRMRDYKDTEGFMGMFSQVGELYNVKHIWCYDSLQDRQKARDVVWSKQQMQWSEIVTHTMPLIRQMDSRIMIPTDYSPTK